MCLIKTSCQSTRPLFSSSPKQLSIEPVKNFCFSKFDYPSQISLPTHYLNNLFATLFNNSQLLNQLQQKTMLSEGLINHTYSLLEQTSTILSTHTSIESDSLQTKEPILKKLFGDKNYKYRLRLKGNFPNLIYKERNFGLQLELVNQLDEPVLNSNLLHLCLGACDVDGQWIGETQSGDYFIKGKIEAELYHGEAHYQKMAPRDVTRNLPHSKMHLVVYPKPSLLKFATNNSSVEQIINADEIEPVIIKDITIRAKKKSRNE